MAFGAGAGHLAMARTTRPLFEPTDLELEDGGVAEIDVQMGAIRSQGPWRAVMPDFELDVGLLPGLELDLDGAYAIEGPATGPFSFDHAAPDSLWPCAKIGLYDAHDGPSGRGLAVGVQVGPKLPVASGAHGIGAGEARVHHLARRTATGPDIVGNRGGARDRIGGRVHDSSASSAASTSPCVARRGTRKKPSAICGAKASRSRSSG